MADEYTTNYTLFLPKPADLMSDVKRNITDSFRVLEPLNDPTVIAAGVALPQAGDYEIGDRVFRNDPQASYTYPSTYLLVVKDANWGWHWRPVQQELSPWVSVPDTAISPTYSADVISHPDYPFQIALDSRGWCHWRGALFGSIYESDLVYPIFNNIPRGLRPNSDFVRMAAATPPPAGISFAGMLFYMDADGSSAFVGNNVGAITDVWLDGIQYNNSDEFYYNG